MPTVRPTVVLADDHVQILGAVRDLLSPEFEILEAVTDGIGLLDAALRLHPDVLIVDIDMPGLSGIEALERLRADGCASAVVMLTTYEDEELAARALEAGAQGYVSKTRLGPDLVRAIRTALAGRAFVSES